MDARDVGDNVRPACTGGKVGNARAPCTLLSLPSLARDGLRSELPLSSEFSLEISLRRWASSCSSCSSLCSGRNQWVPNVTSCDSAAECLDAARGQVNTVEMELYCFAAEATETAGCELCGGAGREGHVAIRVR